MWRDICTHRNYGVMIGEGDGGVDTPEVLGLDPAVWDPLEGRGQPPL